MQEAGKTFLLVLLLLFSSYSTAEQKVLRLSNYPDGKRYFDMVGKRYIAKPDNPYLVERFGRASSLLSYKLFLNQPNEKICKTFPCNRKPITSEEKFVVDSIVSPSDNSSYCKENVIFCYFRLRFDNGDVAYMAVDGFTAAADPITATAHNHIGFLQIYPLLPDETWKSGMRFFDAYFGERGVLQGYTREDVLKSQWGKPASRTYSSVGGVNVEIWLYDGGMLTFENGYVTVITASE